MTDADSPGHTEQTDSDLREIERAGVMPEITIVDAFRRHWKFLLKFFLLALVISVFNVYVLLPMATPGILTP